MGVGELQSLLEHHGLSLVFLNVLLDQAGFPVPAYPMLLVAGALAVRETGPSLAAVFGVVALACLIADLTWYYAGRRIGQPMLKTICRVSITPDSCIRQTQSLYLRVGPRLLVIAKLMPGAGALSTAMAGMTGTPLRLFIFYDTLGAIVWAGAALMVGAAFSSVIDDILAFVSTYGHMALMAVGLALVAFIAWRFWKRTQILRRTRQIPRMTVSELEDRRQASNSVLLLDVRAHGSEAIERIPGALVVDPDSPFDHLGEQHKASDIVIYCSCPNEVSAAILAARLRVAGYGNTWALAGGFEEWQRVFAVAEASNDPHAPPGPMAAAVIGSVGGVMTGASAGASPGKATGPATADAPAAPVQQPTQ
jgi:membrane protein DedA with SNARE-associated domain/rhodanese-related sulfurtransferase